MRGFEMFDFDKNARDLEFDEREIEMLEEVDDTGEWPDDDEIDIGGEV